MDTIKSTSWHSNKSNSTAQTNTRGSNPEPSSQWDMSIRTYEGSGLNILEIEMEAKTMELANISQQIAPLMAKFNIIHDEWQIMKIRWKHLKNY